MLRPATPLSVLFFIAFVLLLLSTLSTPIIKSIPLSRFEGIDYGVFGACKGNQCTKMTVGYDPSNLFSANDDGDFTLSPGTRHYLSSILIVHPIAAFLTLICFCLAVAAHFHSPAHSPRYLLGLLILSFPTLLVTLLAFLVDILLFVPHLQWGGWIVLGATILIIASGVVTCAMRRTLVSRKARKKRIAENAEMNGQNFYANREEERMMVDQLPRADSPPPIDGNKVPQYAIYENKNPDGRLSSEERAPSMRSMGSNGQRRPIPQRDVPPMPGMDPVTGEPLRRPSRDQYGNTLEPDAVAMANDLPRPGMRHHNSNGTLNSQRSGRSNGSRGSYNGRGRGGYPPRGGYGPPRGGYPPRGGFAPRGGMGPYRGGPGGPGGMRGPPPPGWNGGPHGRGMGPGPMMAGAGVGAAAGMMGRRPSNEPPEYDMDYNGHDLPPPPRLPSNGSRNGSPASAHRAQIGQAIELDEHTGSLSSGHVNPYGLRDSDGDVAGMLALQQNRASPMRTDSPRGNGALPSPTSLYSDGQFVPARAGWKGPGPHQEDHRGLSPIQASPPTPRHRRTGSENYYEDVDPRFATDEPSVVGSNVSVPHALKPGPRRPSDSAVQQQHSRFSPLPLQHLHPNTMATAMNLDPNGPGSGDLDRTSSYDNIPEGARSPTGSDASHFTSVSQRGVNPNWRPPPGSGSYGAIDGRGPAPQRPARRDDMILNANPDFTLPGMGGHGPRGPVPARGSPMAGMRSPPPAATTAPGIGLTPGGRYPTEI